MCDPQREFSCGINVCIPLDKLCDQTNDCGNWEDEPKDKCGVDECAVGNGGCSDICMDTAIGFFCECRPGFKLVGNSSCEGLVLKLWKNQASKKMQVRIAGSKELINFVIN